MDRSVWRDSILAVLLGNVIHFLVLEPRLPERLRHHAFQIDSGLVIDFLVCFAVFAAVRWLRKKYWAKRPI